MITKTLRIRRFLHYFLHEILSTVFFTTSPSLSVSQNHTSPIFPAQTLHASLPLPFHALIALPPPTLAPIRGATKVGPRSTKVASGAAKPTPTLLIDYRPARLARARLALRRGRRLRRRSHVVALAEAGLAAVAAVEGLVLDVVFGPAVARRRAAAVEVAVCAGAGARDAALGVAADVDDGDRGREGGCGGGLLFGRAGFERRGCGACGLADGVATGEGL
jgi:hypothetical protein